jgi:hypothetical protein
MHRNETRRLMAEPYAGDYIRDMALEHAEERDRLRAALTEAAMLLETAEQDGYVSSGWREDARSWRACWADALEGKEQT